MYYRKTAKTQWNETPEQEQTPVHVKYDPFGVHKAAIETQTSRPWIVSLGARLVIGLLILVGASPFVLLIGLSVYSQASAYPAVFYLTIILWVWMIAFLATQLRFLKITKKSRVTPTSGERGKVVVIGAGPVGLAVVKECLEQGLEVECFERNSGLGGRFRFDETGSSSFHMDLRISVTGLAIRKIIVMNVPVFR